MGRGKGKKAPLDKEAKLIGDDEFCSFVNAAQEAELRSKLSQLSLDRVNLQVELKSDEHVSSLKTQMSTATERYRIGFKRVDAKVARIRRRLKEMGKPVGDLSEQADSKLEPGATDRFGGSNADALSGKPSEPRPSPKTADQKASEKAVKDFELKIGSHPNSPFNTKS